MTKYLLYYLFCLVILFSCSGKDKVPNSIIQPDKMEDVLWDVMRMQFLAEETASADTSINQAEELKKLTEKVFSIHKITVKKFDNSYNWYVKNPTLLKRIFDSMQVRKQDAFNDADSIHDSVETLNGTPVPGPAKDRELKRINMDVTEAIE